jgi:hypothetical protein
VGEVSKIAITVTNERKSYLNTDLVVKKKNTDLQIPFQSYHLLAWIASQPNL